MTNRSVASSPRLDAYIAEGIRHVMLWFMDAPQHDGLVLFAGSILPRYR